MASAVHAVPAIRRSALFNIARSLFAVDCLRKLVCVMSGEFTCRWDESGVDPGTGTTPKTDLPILVVAGYLAHVEEWIALEQQWVKVLSEYGLDSFHMTEFINNTRPYSTLKGEQREALITSLLDAIADYPRVRISFALSVDDYLEVIKARNLLETDIVRAYHICARRCLEVVSDWARVASYTSKILHIFHHGNPAWPSFEAKFSPAMLDSLNILNPICQSNKDVRSLEAADVLAQQIGRDTLVQLRGKKAPLRSHIGRLTGKAGVRHLISQQELKGLYAEELMIEEHRSRGSFPKRMLNRSRLDKNNAFLTSRLFVEPSNYELNVRTRQLQ
jgi:hypothetical protein